MTASDRVATYSISTHAHSDAGRQTCEETLQNDEHQNAEEFSRAVHDQEDRQKAREDAPLGLGAERADLVEAYET